MVKHTRITSDPAVMAGKPVIRGTRMTVEHILRELGAGATIEALLTSFPHLTRDDILAAQAFSADQIANEEIVFG